MGNILAGCMKIIFFCGYAGDGMNLNWRIYNVIIYSEVLLKLDFDGHLLWHNLRVGITLASQGL